MAIFVIVLICTPFLIWLWSEGSQSAAVWAITPCIVPAMAALYCFGYFDLVAYVTTPHSPGAFVGTWVPSVALAVFIAFIPRRIKLAKARNHAAAHRAVMMRNSAA